MSAIWRQDFCGKLANFQPWSPEHDLRIYIIIIWLEKTLLLVVIHGQKIQIDTHVHPVTYIRISTHKLTCAVLREGARKKKIDAHVRLVSVSCVYFTTLTWPPWKFAAILCTSIKMSLWKSLSHLVGRCLSFDSYTGFSTACDGWVVLAFSVVVQFLQCLRWWFLFCPNFLLVPQLLTS